MPVDVAIHLVFREQQGLDGAESLFLNADSSVLGPRLRRGRSSVLGDQHKGIHQSVSVDLAVRNAAHQRIAAEILDLVEVERSGDQPLERVVTLAADQLHDARRRVATERLAQDLADVAVADEGSRHLFVIQRADLLERVRERVVPDIVQQRRDANVRASAFTDVAQVTALLEQRQRTARQGIRAERVLETRMAGARIYQKRQPELSHVPQPLEGRCVDQAKGERLDTDVIPEGIADDLHYSRYGVGSLGFAPAYTPHPKPLTDLIGDRRSSRRPTRPSRTSRNSPGTSRPASSPVRRRLSYPATCRADAARRTGRP